MKILMLVDNYPPEMNANARIFSELSEILAKNGLDISAITSHPNFPRGKIFPGHKNKWRSKSLENGVNVIRVKTYIYPNKGRVRRSLDFLSFGLSSFMTGLFVKDINCIIGVTPQFFSALSACFLSIIKRKPFLMVLCDLWPDSIASNKMINKNFAFRVLKKVELFMYRKASAIAILSPNFRQYLTQNAIDNSKIIDFISGPKEGFSAKDDKKTHDLLSKYNLHKKLVIGYIGTFGISHNHEDLIEVFNTLNRQDIHLFMIGDGEKKSDLIDMTKQYKLSNVTIDGPVPLEEVTNYWSVCDIVIVPLRTTETNKTVIPSKILEAMKIGLPAILYAPEGEATHFFSKSGACWHIESGNIKKLSDFIYTLSEQMIAERKENAIKFSKKYSRENQAKVLMNTINKICKREDAYEKV